MSTGGGGDRKWTTPVQPDGSRWSFAGVEIYGAHTGRAARYNMANPRPGYVYAWGNIHGTDKLSDEMNGYEPVLDTDEDCPATSLVDESTNRPTSLDTSNADLYGGLRPLRIHEDLLAERLAENARQSLAQIAQGPDQTFLQGATEDELRYGSRFAMRGHSTDIRQGSDIIKTLTNPRQ